MGKQQPPEDANLKARDTKLPRKDARRVVNDSLGEARDTPTGNAGLSTDAAMDAIRRGTGGQP